MHRLVVVCRFRDQHNGVVVSHFAVADGIVVYHVNFALSFSVPSLLLEFQLASVTYMTRECLVLGFALPLFVQRNYKQARLERR